MRSNSPQVLLLVKNIVQSVQIESMMCVGGSQSSGLAISDLKSSGDYLILTPRESGVLIHSLKDGQSLELQELQSYQCADLTVIFMGARSVHQELAAPAVDKTISNLLTAFASGDSLESQLLQVLTTIIDFCEMEKGLIATKDGDTYRTVAKSHTESTDNWISESLFQMTVQSRKPQSVLNLIGSAFSRNESLMATGFLSVFSWPLLVRGEVVGVLLVGSQRPHSGLSGEQKSAMELLVNLVALLTSFVLRDREMKENLRRLQEINNRSELPLLSSSPKVHESCELARKVAPTDLSVLLHGETGVGKEVLARWIHEHSDRRGKPFTAVNCGAIPSELLESVLFGHKKGSFTGAVSDQPGKFQLAHQGTLFLDEIGDLPPILQVKLLRALQEKTIEPVGGRPTQVDVRVLSATHKSLQLMISEGKFREDLFYRLAEIQVSIPALRERPDDVRLLALDYVQRHSPQKSISREAMAWLVAQSWRGNVRELLSSLKRALVLSATSELKMQDFMQGKPAQLEDDLGPVDALNLERARDEFVKRKILQALSRTSGHRNKAAEALGITPRTLFRYLKELNIKDDNSVTLN